jgi:hypothetical protein
MLIMLSMQRTFFRDTFTQVHTGGIDLGPVAAWQKMVARTVVVAPSLLRF